MNYILHQIFCFSLLIMNFTSSDSIIAQATQITDEAFNKIDQGQYDDAIEL